MTTTSRTTPSSLDIPVNDHCISVRGHVERHSDIRMIEVLAYALDGCRGVDVSGLAFTIPDMS